MKAEGIPALGALRSLRSTKKRAAEKRQQAHFLSNEENEIWIEDYVERETTRARKRVEDSEAAVQQEQDDMMHAEQAGLTSREPEKTVEEMLVAVGDSMSDLVSSDDREDGEDEDDEETEKGNLSEDDEPSWVMGTITKTVQQRMERFWQKQMKLNKLTQPGWEDAADYFREQDTKYGITISYISSFRQKHPGVLDGSDGSDGTLYPLTENYTLLVAQATGPSLLD